MGVISELVFQGSIDPSHVLSHKANLPNLSGVSGLSYAMTTHNLLIQGHFFLGGRKERGLITNVTRGHAPVELLSIDRND